MRLRLVDIEKSMPPARLLRPAREDETIDLPAAHLFGHIVPSVTVRFLAKALPDFASNGDEIVRLPAARVALAYKLGEEFAPAEGEKETSQTPERSDLPSPVSSLKRHRSDIADQLPPARVPQRISNLVGRFKFQRNAEKITPPPAAEPPPAPPANPLDAVPTNQPSLQALFHTTETLTLGRVVELFGALPGVQSCILACDGEVVAKNNIPDGVDPELLNSHARDACAMLQPLNEASQRMGIGTVPGLTVHTERGPFSIIQQQSLTMLVFHREDGFRPGVREKMTVALALLDRGRPLLAAPAE